jgi:hypothetical protein
MNSLRDWLEGTMTSWLARAGVCALFLMAGCGAEPEASELWVMMQQRELFATGGELGTGGCIHLRTGNPSPPETLAQVAAGAPAPHPASTAVLTNQDDFAVTREEVAEGLSVRVSSGQQVLATKLLTFEFLESGKTDVIDVTTPAGVRHLVGHKGAHKCDVWLEDLK